MSVLYMHQIHVLYCHPVIGYLFSSLAGAIGGNMGLLLGASLVTLFELFDLIVYNGIKKLYLRHRKPPKQNGAYEIGVDKNGF